MQVALAVALQGFGDQGFDKVTKTTVVASLLKVAPPLTMLFVVFLRHASGTPMYDIQ